MRYLLNHQAEPLLNEVAIVPGLPATLSLRERESFALTRVFSRRRVLAAACTPAHIAVAFELQHALAGGDDLVTSDIIQIEGLLVVVIGPTTLLLELAFTPEVMAAVIELYGDEFVAFLAVQFLHEETPGADELITFVVIFTRHRLPGRCLSGCVGSCAGRLGGF